MIEILQTEDATIETLQGLRKSEQVQQIHYVSYEKKKKSNKPSYTSSKQNSSSTKLCYCCREPYNKKHEEKCRAKYTKCEECQMTGHFKRCCKKLGNFPNNYSNRQNQSTSSGSGRMNVATAVPQLEADFFDERGLHQIYNLPPTTQIGSMNILKKTYQNDVILLSERGEEIHPIVQPKEPNNTPSVSGSVPASDPASDFPQIEFLSTEVVNQSQIDFQDISDTPHMRETGNSSSKATRSTNSPLKFVQNCSSDK